MKSIFKVFCAFTLIVLFQAMPAQSAGKDGTHQVGKSPVKSKEKSGITLQIAGGKIKGNKKVVRVKQGDEVKLSLMADKTTEVHLHGYDIEKTVSPGPGGRDGVSGQSGGPVSRNGTRISLPREEKKRGPW